MNCVTVDICPHDKKSRSCLTLNTVHILYTGQPEKALKITAVFSANYMDHTLCWLKADFLMLQKGVPIFTTGVLILETSGTIFCLF